MGTFEKSPCKDCPERFLACSDKCPKDARGEYGYKTWKAALQKEQAAKKEYNRKRRDDYLRSEECESAVEKWRLSKKYGREK